MSKGLDAGASDYLVKPFTARELRARVGAQHLRWRASASKRRCRRRTAGGGGGRSGQGRRRAGKHPGRFLYAGPGWRLLTSMRPREQLLGASREELLGKNHWDLYPRGLGNDGEREYRARGARPRAGGVRDFSTSSRDVGLPLRASHGTGRHFGLLPGRDRAEASRGRLRETGERLRAIYDGTYEYIGLLSPDGTLLEANRASLEFAGNTREEVVGRPVLGRAVVRRYSGRSGTVRQGIPRAAAGDLFVSRRQSRRPSGEWHDFDIPSTRSATKSGDVVLIVRKAAISRNRSARRSSCGSNGTSSISPFPTRPISRTLSTWRAASPM